jgi:hypothetical protein
LQTILDETTPEIATRLHKLLRDIRNITKATLEAHTQYIEGRTSINRKTLRKLLKNQVAEECPNQNDTVNTVVFLTPEMEKERNRIITWTIIANMLMQYEWDHEVAHQADIIDIVQDVYHQAGAAFDLKCSFYQVLLETEMRRAFVFQCFGKKYRFCRLPMGFVPSAEIMQLITQALGAAVKKAVPKITYRVHVDNILFTGDFDDVAQAIAEANAVARRWNITFSEDCLTPKNEVKFHAVILNFTNRTAQISPKGEKRLNSIAEFTNRMIQHATDRDSHLVSLPIRKGDWPLIKLVSTLTFWGRTIFKGSAWQAGDWAAHFQILQLVRSVAHAFAIGAKSYSMNVEALRRLRAFTIKLQKTNIVQIPNMNNTETICKIATDASCTGGGFILYLSGEWGSRLSVPFPWLSPIAAKDIGTYEVKAIATALASIPQNFWDSVGGNNMKVIETESDSTVAIGAIEKGYSPVAAINSLVAVILSLGRKYKFRLALKHVRTTILEADVVSRAFEPDANPRARVTTHKNGLPMEWEWDGFRFSFGREGQDWVSPDSRPTTAIPNLVFRIVWGAQP